MQSGRRATAEILLHLSELEERRLHLKAGYNSLFAYCLAVHGMSEDEACRRIDVARLGRRFPTIFELLASGALSLSVAALLKECLTEENHADLLASVSGRSVRAVREQLAARFPRPDVPSSIRKLPERVAVSAGARESREIVAPPLLTARADHSNSTRDIAGRFGRSTADNGAKGRLGPGEQEAIMSVSPSGQRRNVGCPETMNESAAAEAKPERPASLAFSFQPEPGRARVEPIAAGRYRVQFTASFEQKQKLEQALDLMAHRNPARDLAALVERGTELLVAELLQQRAGITSRPRAAGKRRAAGISHETRRAVVERDGLRCSFVSEEGLRCEGRAFLEFDHRQPLGKGGDSQSGNVRVLCRAHNRLCAELEYGRAKIEREIARRRDGGRSTMNESVVAFRQAVVSSSR
jgi:hypothetical protein